MSNGVSLAARGEGTSLALVNHPSSGVVLIKNLIG